MIKIVKKITLLLMVGLLISACTTNPVTYDSVEDGKKPLTPWLGIPMMYTPGLSQLLHGEGTEAAIVAGLTYGGLAVSLLLASTMDTGDSGEMPVSAMIPASMVAAGAMYNMVDVYSTSITRQRQYKRIYPEYVANESASLFARQQEEEAWNLIETVKKDEEKILSAYRAAEEGVVNYGLQIYRSLDPYETNRRPGAVLANLRAKDLSRLGSDRPTVRFGFSNDGDARSFVLLAAESGDSESAAEAFRMVSSQVPRELLIDTASLVFLEKHGIHTVEEFFRELGRPVPLRYYTTAEIESKGIIVKKRSLLEQAEYALRRNALQEANDIQVRAKEKYESEKKWEDLARSATLTTILALKYKQSKKIDAAVSMQVKEGDLPRDWEEMKRLASRESATWFLYLGAAMEHLGDRERKNLIAELPVYDYLFDE